MEHITATQAAKQWQLNVRTIQKWAKAGKIPGANKVGRDWVIPANTPNPSSQANKPKPLATGPTNLAATEPSHPHYANHQAPPSATKNSTQPAENPTPLPLMNTAFTPGQALAAAQSLAPDLSQLAKAEYHYFRGEAAPAAKHASGLLENENQAKRLYALLIHSFACLSLGEINQAKTNTQRIKQEMASFTPGGRVPATTGIFVNLLVSVLLHDLHSVPPQLEGTVKYLPTGMKLYAYYAQAHLHYLQGDYGRSLGIAETALSISPEIYPIPAIYLRLVAAMSAMSLRQVDKGREHFDAAWAIAQPDGFLQPFAEHHGLLHGLIEVALKQESPDAYKQIIDITYNFAAGWRQVHSLKTGEDIADILSTTEFTIAMLASKKWTNQQIADHLGISVNTVKAHMCSVYKKLGVDNRVELKRHMLR